MLRKKKVLQESLLCVDWQRYSKRFHEDIQNIRVLFFFSDVCFRREGSLEETIQVPRNLRAKTCKVVLREIFLKSRPLEKEESTRDKLAKSKRAKIGVHSFAGSFSR